MIQINASQRIKAMNAKEAIKKDKSVYVEEEDGDWCVFGDNSGFCYEKCSNKTEATKAAGEWNKKLKRT